MGEHLREQSMQTRGRKGSRRRRPRLSRAAERLAPVELEDGAGLGRTEGPGELGRCACIWAADGKLKPSGFGRECTTGAVGRHGKGFGCVLPSAERWSSSRGRGVWKRSGLSECRWTLVEASTEQDTGLLMQEGGVGPGTA